jgi:hypothetical protein
LIKAIRVPSEVAEGDAPVDQQSLYLVEEGGMGGIVVAA